MSILSCFALKDQLPKKVARSEEETVEKTVVEAVDESVEDTVEETARVSVEDESVEETVEDTIEETVENPLETGKKRGLSGAATYRCFFKKEWSTRWPFITMGTTSSFYWCSVCRQENSCEFSSRREGHKQTCGRQGTSSKRTGFKISQQCCTVLHAGNFCWRHECTRGQGT